MTQPEALRLADLLDERPHDALDFLPAKAADELRRLHAQRDALLEALAALMDEQSGPPLIRRQGQWQAAMDKASAAIAKAEGDGT